MELFDQYFYQKKRLWRFNHYRYDAFLNRLSQVIVSTVESRLSDSNLSVLIISASINIVATTWKASSPKHRQTWEQFNLKYILFYTDVIYIIRWQFKADIHLSQNIYGTLKFAPSRFGPISYRVMLGFILVVGFHERYEWWMSYVCIVSNIRTGTFPKLKAIVYNYFAAGQYTHAEQIRRDVGHECVCFLGR